MNELESQVAKLELGGSKDSHTFVYQISETIPGTTTEIFVLAEMPVFNPAATADCNQICEAIAGTVRRTYNSQGSSATFEQALSAVNAELSKLNAMGKTHWLNKLNSVIAAKQGDVLSMSSVGRMTALLYREKQFIQLTEPAVDPQPMKTFENFSEGTLQLNDVLILSTRHLLNYIAIDRIRQILNTESLEESAGLLFEILEDNRLPEESCGTIVIKMTEPETDIVADEVVNMEPALPGGMPSVTSDTKQMKETSRGSLFLDTATGTVTSGIMKAGELARQGIQKLRHSSDPLASRISNAFGVSKDSNKLQIIRNPARTASKYLPSTKGLEGLSWQKKFFLASALVLVLVLGVSIFAARNKKTETTAQNQVTVSTEKIQSLLNDANAALIYGDIAKARSVRDTLLTELNGVPEAQRGQIESQLKAYSELQTKLNKEIKPETTILATLSNSDHLITMPEYFATMQGEIITSYTRKDGKIQDTVLKSTEPIPASVYFKPNQTVVYSNGNLFVWNYQTNLLGKPLAAEVAAESFGGIDTYPVNNRVYVADTAASRIMNYTVSGAALTKPSVSVQDPVLADTQDIAIDGNIYALTRSNILKFNSGKAVPFTPAWPVASIGAKSKIITSSSMQQIYVLDTAAKQIYILSKDGALINTVVSEKFTKPTDFAVDEAAKTVYVLNGNELLKLQF